MINLAAKVSSAAVAMTILGVGIASALYGEVFAALERDFRSNPRLDAMFREALDQLLASR